MYTHNAQTLHIIKLLQFTRVYNRADISILFRYIIITTVFDVRFSAMTWSFLLLLLKIITRINRRADVLYTRTTNVELVLEAFEPE